ncbi:hypothetical protein SAMN04488528_1003152 [Clostridium frigidicarnis]|uniref:DUF3784 domain-containing protein n=2 Tax=Clostridium frigidicarnis TaxID=84698 RepID=A0A1I0VZD6_9CLOT|nr:hypothetical protein SAMN04488528_1003152 [Clostridium frigidicarnis]
MQISTIIMVMTSLLFFAMGMGVFLSKTFKSLEEEKRNYVKINGMIYTFVGLTSLIIAVFDYMTKTKVTLLIFVFIIFVSAVLQLILSKTLNK